MDCKQSREVLIAKIIQFFLRHEEGYFTNFHMPVSIRGMYISTYLALTQNKDLLGCLKPLRLQNHILLAVHGSKVNHFMTC